MDSGTIESEEAREKVRWNENSKVYTRKIRNKNNAANNNHNSATSAIADEATTTATNNSKNGTAEKDESTQNVNGNAITEANYINSVAQSPTLQPAAAEDADFHQHQPNLPRIELGSRETKVVVCMDKDVVVPVAIDETQTIVKTLTEMIMTFHIGPLRIENQVNPLNDVCTLVHAVVIVVVDMMASAMEKQRKEKGLEGFMNVAMAHML